jgi:acetolactate synthase-1/2/3 large subunit
MKTTDLIAEFLAKQGIGKVYTVSGGGDLHMIDSICKRSDIRIICPQNEQNAAYAADAAARISGLGCAIATSGPGATHMVSGIATSYYDSIPVLYITGNQTRQRLGTGLGVRQFGFQSMPFIECVKGFTKYAKIIMDPMDTLYELEKAVYLAKTERPGPVVIDIPDDIQRADVDPAKMGSFPHILNGYYQPEVDYIGSAQRPVIALGWGVHLSGGRKAAWDMVTRLGIPCVTTWGAADVMVGHPNYIGTWGTHGVRAANFAIQKADLVLAIGTRLDTKATGSPASSFAPNAKLVMVDVDRAELAKMEKIGRPCVTVQTDAKRFMEAVKPAGDYGAWRAQIAGWQRDYPAVLPEYPWNSPYRVLEALGAYLTPDDVVVSDTGCPLAWAMQVLPFKGRFIHAFNQTPMGYGLGGAIGVAGEHKGRTILITGDGGLSECITEFATIHKHQLDIRVILFNNHGHAMCRQTQKQWLGGIYHGTSSKDLATPNFSEVARAYGITVVDSMERLFAVRAPAFLEIMVDEEQGVVPQVRFGKAIEDADPALPDDVLAAIMAS